MTQGRRPLTTTTRLYGHFADVTEQRPLTGPLALINALLDQRGVDALYVPFQVPADHCAAAIAGLRHLRYFAGFTVTMPHKGTAARLCDVLLPNAQACGVVNVVRIEPDGQLIGETFDGVAMVQALTAYRTLDATTRVLVVGAGGCRAGYCDRTQLRGGRDAHDHQSDAGEGRRTRREGATCGLYLYRRDPTGL
jgi:shikimate dehydrogenase